MKINLFNTKVTRHEEVDFDNKRLVYVNDLVPVTTHSYEDHTLSTDQVISLFDGGYRVGVLEQLDSLKQDSREFEYQMRVLVEQLHECMDRHGVEYEEGKKLRTSLEKLLNDFQLKIESNLKKKFDVCQYSNEERVRDKRVKEKGEEFISQLLNSFRNLP